MRKPSSISFKIFTVAGIAVLTGCGGLYNDYDVKNPDPMDKPTGLKKEDFIQNLTPAPKPKPAQPKVELKEPPIPKMSEVLTAPKPPKIASDKTVTISVTEDIQLKDVFLELSRLADIDIAVDPSISGGVIFKAKDRPIGEVIERITDMAGLRYTIKNNMVYIETDSPYVESYQASFLNLIRKNKGQISANTQLDGGGAAGGGGGSNGSQSSINIEGGDSDLWATLEREINAIVGATVPAAGAAGAAAATGEQFVTLNRQAGTINVKAPSKAQKKVKEYLDRVRSYYSSQVLIEAKVVEVTLNDEFNSGIDWSILSKNGNGVVIDTPELDEAFATLTLARGNISTAVTLAQVFGTTRTLSSPRLLTMNNQQAVLSFARNENYFSLTCDVTDPEVNETTGAVTKPAKLSVTSALKSVPIGIILSLQPSIDSKQNEITMNIRPTLSRLTGEFVSDPAITICLANAQALGNFDQDTIEAILAENQIPQADIREMDSVLKLKNGEVMAIGGMIEQRSLNTDTGVPFASDIPIIGNAFKSVSKVNNAVQTVIFLKATIVPGYGVDGSDKNLYNKFNTDPRPLDF